VRFEVVYIEGDGKSPFPLWDVRDTRTDSSVRDGIYATEGAAYRRADTENQNVTPAA
jgi:hypothetical protein